MEEQNSQSRFLSAFEAAQEMLRVTQALVAEVIKLGGSEEDLKDLLRDQRRLRRTAEAILGKRSSDLPIDLTGPDEYRVFVKRGPLPDKCILDQQFSPGGVSVELTDAPIWRRYRLCIDGTDGYLRMKLHRFSVDEMREVGGLTTENVIRWGLKRGLRPADHEEVYAFGIGPETMGLSYETPIVGLGAYIEYRASRLFPRLGYMPDKGRVFWYELMGDVYQLLPEYASFLFIPV